MSPTQTVKPLRAREWTPDNVAVATAAAEVRCRLRRLMEKAPVELRSEIGNLCNVLSIGLKARHTLPRSRFVRSNENV